MSGTADVPPVVAAGSAQTVMTGATVALSGSATDSNGQVLTPTWSFSSVPAGSGASLSNTHVLSPTFTADRGGVYDLLLSVTDGTFTVTATTRITANARPVADAGPAQAVLSPTTVTLDGSLSGDPDGDVITYLWSLSRPAGSSAVLSNASAQRPTFVADIGGPYSANLTVFDGVLTSAISTVLVTANTRPVANAGPAQSVSTTAVVQLNGGLSSDADGDTLTYVWTLTKPPGSAAALSNAAIKTPTFVADIAGTYTASLKVNDGKIDSLASPASTVAITATVGNAPPIAHATVPASAVVGATVTFDGTTSTDADGDTLTYSWSLTRPATSAAVLSSTTAAKPTIIADVAGTFTANLVVNDGTVNSAVAASASVLVSLPAPTLTISATSLPFSAAAGSSTTSAAVIGNSGSAPLILTSLTFSGPQASEFTLAPSNGCTAAQSIAVSSNCTLVVSFHPLVAGARTATLTIVHSATGSPQVVTLQGTATAVPQGKIELSALTLAFPDTTVADSSSVLVTIRNTGNLSLNFSAFSIGGAAAADFSQSGTCVTTAPLAVLAECTLSVVFRPTIAGPRAASLTIQSDASNGAATLALTGVALASPAPVVTLGPAPTLAFQTQTVNGLYPPRPVLLSNTGNADLTTATIAVSGTGFAIAGTSTCPLTLAPGTSCTINVSFLASAIGNFTGTLRVTSNADGSPHTVALTGTGTTAAVPILTWSPATTALDFGMVSSGEISATQSVILKNEGPGGAQIAFLNAVGPDSFAFSVDAGTCPIGSPLFEGATCRIDIRFAPGSAGAKRASVQVASSGSFPPQLSLSGTGLSGPGPGVSTSVGSLDFGSTSLGSASLPATVLVTSNGTGVLNVASIEVTGPYAIQSTTCPIAPFVLNAGANCTIAIRFQPVATGSSTGTLRITSDASPSVRDIALAGKGEAPTDVSGGGGGCTIAGDDAALDPMLWWLALAALAMLARRARVARRRAVAGRFFGEHRS
ncbi:MAG: choice-of-anchor D domain-containing protein [Caldimonas sp.]